MKLMFTEGHSVFEGVVTHERFTPKQHRFSYKLFYLLIDLDQIDQLGRLSTLWSVNKTNLVQFKYSDYMHYRQENASIANKGDLKTAVIDVIFDQTKENFNGKIFLLSNLRYWGYCFNPVSYYFCFDKNGNLQYIVDEVTNTPWKERHHYVHKAVHKAVDNVTRKELSHVNHSQTNNNTSSNITFKFEKTFHVSPFMPMNMFYKTTYVLDNNKILIHMDLFKNSKREVDSREKNKIFFATMNLQGKPLTKTIATVLPFKFPFQCSKIIMSIYWQALKLWIKRVPFISHPHR